MAVTVSRTQIRSVLAGPAYRVQDTCDAAVGIPREIYVFSVADDSFLYVATVHDVLAYPAGRAAALLAGQERYRLPQVTRDFTSLATASEFAASIKPRVQALCSAYDVAVGVFSGATSETVTS